MPANSSYSFTAGQILTATDLNAVFAQTVAFAADSSNANTGTLPEARLPYRMDQNVRSNSAVQFSDVTVSGNLTVSGTTTFVNTSVLDIKDINITLAKGSANSLAANGAGFTIDGAGVGLTYIDATNSLNFDTQIKIGNSTVNSSLSSQTLTVKTSVVVNTEVVANTSGVFTTGTVNAASHTVGTDVVANTSGVFTTGTVNAAVISTSGVSTNTSGSYPTSNTVGTALGAADKRWVITANSIDTESLTANTANVSSIDVGADVSINTTSIAVGNVAVNTTTVSVGGAVINSTAFTGTANNADYLGGVPASSYVSSASNSEISGLLTLGNTSVSGNIVFSNGTVIANGSAGLIDYVLTSDGSGGIYWGDLSATAVNTDATFIWTNNHTWGNSTVQANVTFANGVIIANGSFGSSGQVLTSNGTAMFWAAPSLDTTAQYTWTNDHSWGNTTQSANVTVANGNIIFSNDTKLYANGGFGSNNQVLQSNGSAMFWGNGLTVYYANNDQAYP